MKGLTKFQVYVSYHYYFKRSKFYTNKKKSMKFNISGVSIKLKLKLSLDCEKHLVEL